MRFRYCILGLRKYFGTVIMTFSTGNCLQLCSGTICDKQEYLLRFQDKNQH